MKRARRAAAWIGIAAAACGTGCSGYRAPTLSASSAAAGARTDAGQEAVFVLDARNDNKEALPLREVTYSLELDGREVFTGTRSAEQTLRRLGTQQIRLPVVVSFAEPSNRELVSGVRKYRLWGSLTYVTPGALAEELFDAGVRVPESSFNVEGQIDFGAGIGAPPPTQPTAAG